jgi:hypothetical protein
MKCEPRNPTLLIPDNHNNQVSLLSYQHRRDNGNVTFSFSIYLSHKLQPLIVTFYRPLKFAFYTECYLFMKTRFMTQMLSQNVDSVLNKHHTIE